MDIYLVVIGLTLPSLVQCLHDKGNCGYPQNYNTGELIAESFMISTRVTYKCDKGYFGDYTDTIIYECVNSSGIIEWQVAGYEKQCDPSHPVTNNELGRLNSTDLSSNVNRTIQSDHCGRLPTVPHAKPNLSVSIYLLGQEFNYSSHANGNVQPGSLGVLRCMICKGSAIWVNLTNGCIQKTYGSPKIEATSWTETYGSPKIEATSWTAAYITFGVIFLVVVIFLLSFYGKDKVFRRSCLRD